MEFDYRGYARTEENGIKYLHYEGKVMVEYASPNTNKPLHLGHLRNIFLGHSLSRILQAAGAGGAVARDQIEPVEAREGQHPSIEQLLVRSGVAESVSAQALAPG